MTSKSNFQRVTPLSLNSRSVARVYPTGVAVASLARPGLKSVSVQNLEATNPVQFWHGLIPIVPLNVAADPNDIDLADYLPEDPNTWDAGQLAIATTVISTYGEKVKGGEYLEPFITPNQIIYSYVATGTVTAHVKEGY